MSIALAPKAPRGVVMRFPRSRRGGGGRFRATSTQQRTNLTYAAFITDWPPLQPLLLQFIIASSKNAFLNRDWRRLPSASPDTFFCYGDRAHGTALPTWYGWSVCLLWSAAPRGQTQPLCSLSTCAMCTSQTKFSKRCTAKACGLC